MGLFDAIREFRDNEKEIKSTVDNAYSQLETVMESGDDFDKQIWLRRFRKYGINSLSEAQDILKEAKKNLLGAAAMHPGKIAKIKADLEGSKGLLAFLRNPRSVHDLETRQ